MRTLTTAQLLDAVIQGDLGEPVTRTAVRNQDTSAGPRLFVVPAGKVALVTGITLQGGTGKSGLLTVYQPSPAVSAVGLIPGTYGSSAFLSFRRPETHFMGTSTPTVRAAPPGNVILWQPKHPIPLPSLMDITANGTLGDFGNHASIDMVWVDAAHAGTLGIDINADNTRSRHQLRGALVTSVAAALVPGRKGLHTRIKDLYIRMQPGVPGTANVLRIYQKGNSANNGDTVEVDIFRFVNDNIVDALDIPFSPDEIFLRNGADLFVSCTISNSASVVASCYYSDPSECEANAFWSSLNPNFPGTTNGVLVAALARKVNTAFTLYYPKTNTTATVPGKNKQHIVRGITASVQKKAGRFYAAGATMIADQTLFSISQGAASGSIAFGLIGETQPNVQMIPTLYASEHHQNVLLVDDRKNCVCKPDDGQIWFNSLNIGGDGSANGAATNPVATTDADIVAWGFTVFGRTIPTRFRTQDHLGV